MILVLDASPLITLARIQRLDVLPLLADTIYIPEAVYVESVTQAGDRPGHSDIAHAEWIGRRQVNDQAPCHTAPHADRLGRSRGHRAGTATPCRCSGVG